MAFNRHSAQEIAQQLAHTGSLEIEHEPPLDDCRGDPRAAAVLLPLFMQNEQWRLLFIRRAENPLDRHSGEVAFPGGRIEMADPHPEAAALREAEEEIRLPADGVEILGQLPALITSSNYRVTPIVGQIDAAARLTPDPREVARIFSIPLSWLAEPDNYELRPWLPHGHQKPRQVIFFRPYEGEKLWGVSARITLNFVQALLNPNGTGPNQPK